MTKNEKKHEQRLLIRISISTVLMIINNRTKIRESTALPKRRIRKVWPFQLLHFIFLTFKMVQLWHFSSLASKDFQTN